ncbi:MAG: hypothetical protein P8Z31_03645 [Gammaproteobacteria bacterium]
MAIESSPLLVGISKMDGNLRWHAPDACSGGPESTTIDQERVMRQPADFLDHVQAGMPGTDDGNVDESVHGVPR